MDDLSSNSLHSTNFRFRSFVRRESFLDESYEYLDNFFALEFQWSWHFLGVIEPPEFLGAIYFKI